MDVVLVRWPAEADRRAVLVAQGWPRLLLVDGETSPPAPADCLEDWVRVPAAEDDVRARVAAVDTRASAHRSHAPVLADGVLRLGSVWVALPPVETRLAAALLDRYEAVVGRDTLTRAGWPTGTPQRNLLDVHILRLRRRLVPISLTIKTVRSRGYLLEQARPAGS